MALDIPRLGALQTDPASGLHYRLLLRPATAPAPKRLLVLLHGVGSHEGHLADLAHGVPDATLVAAVRGPLTLGPQQFAWFQVQFGPTGPRIDAPQAEHSRGLLLTLLAQLQAQHGVAASATVLAGFSQGGIMSASVALSAPQSLQGFGLLSGRILPELEPLLADGARLAGLRGFVSHGRQDAVLPLAWAERSHAWLQQLGVPHAYRLYDGGHGVSAANQADFVAWLAGLGDGTGA